MLHHLRAANPDAGVRFLEHLVLQKRRTVGFYGSIPHTESRTLTFFKDPALHTDLALTYIDELLSFLADDATSKLWRAKGTIFRTSS